MNKRVIAASVISLPLLVACTGPQAKTTSTEEAEWLSRKAKTFDRYITSMNELDEFNGNVLVAEKGKVIYKKAIGQRSAEKGDLLTLDSQFRLASLSKPFTAMAVMRLKEAGKLDYEDDVRKHIPEWPYEGATIRNLLNHTSGVPPHVQLFDQHWKPELRRDDPARIIAGTRQMIQMFIDHQPEVYFQPGDQYGYSDTGYVLLAIIAERVSGVPFHQYMRESVFLPAGMKDTYVFSPHRADPLKNRVYGITPALDGSGLKTLDFHYLCPLPGAGSVFSTLADLYSWDRALYTEELVSASTLQEAFTPVTLNNGDSAPYGFGWSIRETSSGGKLLAHSGYKSGFGVELIRRPEEDASIIILTNRDLYLWDGIIQNLTRIFEGEEYKLAKLSLARAVSPVLLNEGIESARQRYLDLKRNHPDDYDFSEGALVTLATTLRREGYLEEAVLVHLLNIEQYPRSPEVRYALGVHYFALNDYRTAEEHCRMALQLDPEFVPSKRLLEYLEKMRGDA